MVKAYLRFCLDGEDSFISAASNSNSNTNCYCILLFFRIWLSGEVAAYLDYSAMVGGDSLVDGLRPPPDDSAVTPPVSAHYVVAVPKLTEEEHQSPLGSTFG